MASSKKAKLNLLLWSLLLVTFFIRFFGLGQIPAGASPEEARFGVFVSQIIGVHITSLLILRLPFALLGTLGVFLFYEFILKVGTNKNLALISSFILALTPWHIQESRIFSWGIFLFLIVLLLLLLFRRMLVKNAGIGSSLLLIACLLSFVISIFNFPSAMKNEADYQRNIASKRIPVAFTRVFSNKLVESFRFREGLFFEQLDFGNYFFSGYPRPRWGVEEYPKLFVAFLPFLLIGLFKIQKESRLILTKLFLAYSILLAALGLREPVWGLPLLLVLVPIIAVGLIEFYESKRFKLLKFVFFTLLIFESAYFVSVYSSGIGESQFSKRSNVYAELTTKVLSFSKEYDQVLVTSKLGDPKVYFDFYVPELKGKVVFSDFDLKKDSSPKTLFVGVLPFEPSPSEPLFKKDGNWPEFISVLAEFEDGKKRQNIIVFSSHL